jgi:hypothetical protein
MNRPFHVRGAFKKYAHNRKQKTVSSHTIDRNCNVLPLSLEDLLNYTTLMIKFCTNKPIWASLLRRFFLGGGKGSFRPKNGCNAPSAGYRFPRKKNPPQAQYVL